MAEVLCLAYPWSMNDTNRREFLKTSVKGAAVLGVGLSSLSLLTTAQAAADKADVSMPGDKKPVTNEELLRLAIIGPAELSLVTSQLAVEKATNKNTKEFAGFELTEAIAVTTVLKELGTPVPTPDGKAKATLEKLKSAEKGAAFDEAYITAQLENHEFLRDTAADYLERTQGSKENKAEQQTQHLATLALATFKEHVAITRRISGELKA